MKERNEEREGDTASRNGKYRRALPAYGLISRACSRFSYFVFSFAEYGMRFKENEESGRPAAVFRCARSRTLGERSQNRCNRSSSLGISSKNV